MLHFNPIFSLTITRCLLGTAIFFVTSLTPAVQAEGKSTPAPADPTATEAAETAKESVRPTLDLGKFKINDLRPTRNETAKLTFSLHLAFSKSLTPSQVAQLEPWKHRLRDQVITAVRISQIKDFQQPDLGRLRRKILIRINRLLQTKLAEEVLMTEYIFRTR